MAKAIEKKTEVISDEVVFRWSFSNSAENLLQGVITSIFSYSWFKVILRIRQGFQASEREKPLQQRFSTLAKSIESIMDDFRFSDITLKVGEDTFQAHKAILASRSKVFDGIFESGMKESQEDVVQMVDIKSSTVKEMLYYIYTGKIEELSMDRAMNLYAAADRYDLPELLGWCKDFIAKHISADDVCNVSVLAELHRDEELSKAARSVFTQHSKTIVNSQGWRDLAENHPSVYKDFIDSILIDPPSLYEIPGTES